MHRRIFEARLHVQTVDAPRKRIRIRRRLVLDDRTAVHDLQVRHRERLARALAIRLLLLPLHQIRDVPAGAIVTQQDEWLLDSHLPHRHAARDELRDAVFDLQPLQRDDVLAVDIDGYIAELHAIKEVASEAANRQIAVDVLLRFANHESPQPVLEPRRLRCDQQKGNDADEQRADERDDLQRAPQVFFRR